MLAYRLSPLPASGERVRERGSLIAFILILLTLCASARAAPQTDSSPPSLDASQLAVIVNVDDPQSVAVGDYYRRKRNIPAANIVRIHLRSNAASITAAEFAQAKQQMDRQLTGRIQALALTWLRPYRVECMSITTAFAIGFDKAFCGEGCKLTRMNPYFDSHSRQPAVDFGLRPAMSIAAVDLQQARALIDRGVRSDGTAPKKTAYLVSTSDKMRDVRASRYALAQAVVGDEIAIQRIDAEALEHKSDVMFYFIGAMRVPQLNTNRFLPGAVADHLTSTGGALTDTNQMSSLRWLEAGATGSYGTVVEPCNFTAKFPDPVVMMKHYLAGNTLVEAYWKSVAMPGQGIFIGEPLAKPYSQ